MDGGATPAVRTRRRGADVSATLAGRHALVTDAHTTAALAVVRSLAAAGMSVSVVREAGRFSLAAASRHAHRVVSLPSVERHPALHLEGLLREVESRGYDILIPTTDSTIALVRSAREAIERAVRVALPHEQALAGAQDKQITVQRAEASAVSVPQTRVFTSVADLVATAESLRYPCVVKPRFSRQWDGVGPMARGTVKYAQSPAALRRIFETSRLDPAALLIQEFVHGSGTGVFALMQDGAPLAVFAHRRLREANPSGGRASLAMSIAPDERLIAPAMRLLAALDWTGVAMVEFKDPGAGAPPIAMEVNGRFWGSLPLAIASGVDFPVLLARQVLGLSVDAPSTYRVGVKCRHLTGDLSHLIAALKGPPRDWTGPFPGRIDTLAAIAPWPGRWRPFNLRLTDPAPAMGEAADFIRQTTRACFRRREAESRREAAEQP